MLKRDKKILDKLFKIAEDLPYTYRVKICAAIYHNNSIISYGFPAENTLSLQRRFKHHTLAVYAHAEVSAIHNALKRVDKEYLKQCTLYICRAKRAQAKGKFIPGIVKPCGGCHEAIDHYGLRRVIYTVNDTLDKSVLYYP